jgi:hypothetical protein
MALVSMVLGCKGVPARTYCYQVSDGIVRTVDLGMRVAGDLHRAGHLSDVVVDRLVSSHDVYRPVAVAVVSGCKALPYDDTEEAEALIAKLRAASAGLLDDLGRVGK